MKQTHPNDVLFHLRYIFRYSVGDIPVIFWKQV